MRFVRRRARGAALALVLPLNAACGDARGSLVVVSDTTAAAASRVVALPFDPAELPAAAPATIPGGPLGDSVRLALARRDSVARADAAFQEVRRTANDAARALAPLDRRSADYAGRFAAWTALADSAERLRASRDAHTRRLAALVARLGDHAALLGSGPPTRPRAAADSAARPTGRSIAEAALARGVATLELAPGPWWITPVTEDGALRLPAVRREVTARSKDTVELK
ncbi:MAG TPA: hypothetical protein VK922_14550 [Gemmatimonadaceae bacterium]|nr:hypothetical protein [Gemmatimonadaceae bacterium]